MRPHLAFADEAVVLRPDLRQIEVHIILILQVLVCTEAHIGVHCALAEEPCRHNEVIKLFEFLDHALYRCFALSLILLAQLVLLSYLFKLHITASSALHALRVSLELLDRLPTVWALVFGLLILRLLDLGNVGFLQLVHSGLENELQIRVEVVDLAFRLLAKVVRLDAQLLGILLLELLRLHFNLGEDAVVAQLVQLSDHMLVRSLHDVMLIGDHIRFSYLVLHDEVDDEDDDWLLVDHAHGLSDQALELLQQAHLLIILRSPIIH